MPIQRTYNAGSVIFFEGDKSEEIYLIKSGQVGLTRISEETSKEINETVKVGEFFGIKSVLGRYKREETAQVLANSEILVFVEAEFEKYAMNNLRLIVDFLRNYSHTLRILGKLVNKKLSTSPAGAEVVQIDPAVELFKIGEYYLKNKQFAQAKYAFSKYLEHYPNGKHVNEANNRMDLASRGISNFTPIDVKEREVKEKAERQLKQAEVIAKSKPGEKEKEKESAKPEKQTSTASTNEVSPILNEFQKMFDKKRYPDIISGVPKKMKPIERDGLNKDDYDCVFLLLVSSYRLSEQLELAIETANRMLKNDDEPSNEMLKLLYWEMGQIYQAQNDDDKAITFYKRILKMTPIDEISEKAEEALVLLGEDI